MKNIKKTNGITLIALIISVVILVLLSVTTMHTIFFNGNMLDNSQNMVSKYNKKAQDDADYLSDLQDDLHEPGDGIYIKITTDQVEYEIGDYVVYSVSIINESDKALSNIRVADELTGDQETIDYLDVRRQRRV